MNKNKVRGVLLSVFTIITTIHTNLAAATPAAGKSPGTKAEEILKIKRGSPIADQVLVKFKQTAGIPNAAALKAYGVTGIKPLAKSPVIKLGNKQIRSRVGQWARVHLKKGSDNSAAINKLLKNPNVEIVEPDYEVSINAIPNDPQFPQLWGMDNSGQSGGTPDADIDAPEAWNIQTGSGSVVVGVIDTGVDYTHEDLSGNMWVNVGEIAGNGLDDDGNGYVDDVHGYDFANDDGDPFDDHFHGTHVAGTIGAVGNNSIGVSGIAWTANIMALKFLGASGSGSVSDAVQAVDYATQMGARITNNSWGGGGFSQALMDAILDANDAGVLFVAAAGNAANNNDVTSYYPTNYDVPNVVSVAATDHNDQLASFSNYGATTVDLAAPGVSIYSTMPDNQYGLLNGTSMATPHVSGVAALLYAEYPFLNIQGVKYFLFGGGDVISSLQGVVATGARVNVANAIGAGSCNPGQLNLNVISPGNDFRVFADTQYKDESPVPVVAYLHDCTATVQGAYIIVAFDNGDPFLHLYDDGQHNDDAANDGIYGNYWDPGSVGPALVTVLASHPSFGGGTSEQHQGEVATNNDVDGDGLTNEFETSIGTDPAAPDTDGDGLTDLYEVCFDGDCAVYAPYPAGGDLNAVLPDTDSDSYDDRYEIDYAGNSADPLILPWNDIIVAEQASAVGSDSCMTVLSDVNQDGTNDIAVGTTVGADNSGGSVSVYSGRFRTKLYTIDAPTDVVYFGRTCADAGDVNADGFTDLVVSTGFNQAAENYAILIYSGNNGSLLKRLNFTVPAEKLDPYLNTRLKVAFSPKSVDFNGDRVPDLAAGVSAIGELNLISGEDGTLIRQILDPLVGYTVAATADMDGGGVADIISGFPNAYGTVKVYSSETGAVIHAVTGEFALDQIGEAVAAVNDMNNDGVPDFAAGGLGVFPFTPLDKGVATVYSGADSSIIYRWRGPVVADLFGSVLDAYNLGDDAVPDMLVGAPWGDRDDSQLSLDNGEIYVYRGSDGEQVYRFHTRGNPTVYRPLLRSAGDLNADGIDDIVFTRDGDELHFLLSPAQPPEIPYVLPISMQGSVGDLVILIGSNFCAQQDCIISEPVYGEDGNAIGVNEVINPNIQAALNGMPVTITYLQQNVIHFSIPEGATSGPITVTTPAGTGTTAEDFIVLMPPQISGFAPSSGPVGTAGNIQGSNFCYENCGLHISRYTDISVQVNGTLVTDAWVFPTVILYYVPEGATTGPITVTNSHGSDTTLTDFVITQ